MKIINSAKTHELDSITIERQGITSLDLMERASGCLTAQIMDLVPDYAERRFLIFCGGGNNGGDGLAIGRMLNVRGASVECMALKCFSRYSADYQANYNRIASSGLVKDLYSAEDFPEIHAGDVVVDAIFGSGLSRPIQGLSAETVKYINASPAMVIAVDTPSGLPDNTLPAAGSAVVEADVTLAIQAPFLSMLMPESQDFVGRLRIVDIGLDGPAMQAMDTPYSLSTMEDIRSIYRPRRKFSHKGTFGHALIVAGSYGKGGAAVLCARACHRAGAGLVTAHIPASLMDIMQISSPETMVDADNDSRMVTELGDISKYQAVGAGPGLGTGRATADMIRKLVLSAAQPMVLDADALNIIAADGTLMESLPADTIITPHPKEFERLFGKTDNALSRLELARAKSEELGIIIVLKGAYTAVCRRGRVCFNDTGNPSMATAGSGDVLTGIIAALLAQRYEPMKAALMGVWIHGLSADIRNVPQGLTAGDIVEGLPDAMRAVSSF